jgi:membrane-bound serine protease (ClpP class)
MEDSRSPLCSTSARAAADDSRGPARAIARLMRVAVLLLALVSLFGVIGPARAQTDEGAVVIVPVRDVIDLGLAPYLARVIDQAAAGNARAVILEINTPGGRLDAALQMQDTLLGAPVRTIAFVNRDAFSAGALIAIAAEEIYMAPGSAIGAATPVDGAGDTADEKTVSAVRATFRSTAESRGRDPLIAEAMVDPAIEIPDLSAAGQLLTLTTEQAREVGYADGVVADRAALLEATGLADAPIEEPRISPAESLVRFLTNPIVASLLVSLGFLLILADIFSGGFGAIGGVGLLLFGLFFWGHFLAGLAGWEGVALVVAGLALIAIEIFVIPGFGVAGVLGIVALVAGLGLSLVGGDITTPADIRRAVWTITGMLVLMISGAILLLRYLPRAARMQGLILQSQVGVLEPPPIARPKPRRLAWVEGERLEAESATYARPEADSPPRSTLLGARGVALSDLRPGGFADIAGDRVDVVTRGEYINAGEPIEVIADQGYRRVVRRAAPSPDDSARA